jgi:hypothetical protein
VLEVFIVGNRILMKYKPSANMYIGSIYGIEFQSKGPKVDEIKDFRS